MRNTLLGFLAILFIAVPIFGQSAVANEPGARPSPEAEFPNYSREDVMRVCLSEYGMGNSSIIDCLADDQKVRDALAGKWANIDASFRKSCLARLGALRVTSYAHLDTCVRSAEREKDAPPQD